MIPFSLSSLVSIFVVLEDDEDDVNNAGVEMILRVCVPRIENCGHKSRNNAR